jgi:CubicO group peptidase (beta-lactamase class C family)
MNPLQLFDQWSERRGGFGVLGLTESGSVDVVATGGDIDAVCELASVTKLLVTMAVLVAAEQGDLLLDDPAGPPGATIRHLLSHSSGLAPDQAAVLAPPGTRRIYSNSGFEILGQCLESSIGQPWQQIVSESVTGPLKMTSTSAPEGSSSASGERGTIRDLVLLAGQLLELQPRPQPSHQPIPEPSLISAGTLAQATAVIFPGLPGVVPGVGRYEDCVWGLGFELKGAKKPHWTATTGSARTFGHFGRSGSFLWVDPDEGLACVAGGGLPFGPWALEAWPAFSDAVLAEWGRNHVFRESPSGGS